MHVRICYVYWFIDFNCNIALLIECYRYVCMYVWMCLFTVHDSSSAALASSTVLLSMNEDTQKMWTHFMDGVSLLQAIDITGSNISAMYVCRYVGTVYVGTVCTNKSICN